MASWQNLSGYLLYKPGGPFSRLKSSKRQYYVFDEKNCRLFCYRNEEEGRRKSHLGFICMQKAAVSPSTDDTNQFVIHSEGKEHIFVADSHRTMMIWVMALQAKRDSWDKRVHLGSSGASPGDETRVRNGRDTSQPKKKMGEVSNWRSQFTRKTSLQVNGNSSAFESCPLKTSPASRKRSMPPEITTVPTGSVTSHHVKPSAQYNHVPEHQEDILSPLRRNSSPSLSSTSTSGDVLPSAGGSETEPGKDFPSRDDGKCPDSSPETESASESDRLGVQEADDDDDDDEECTGLVPLLQISPEGEVEANVWRPLNGFGDARISSSVPEIPSTGNVITECDDFHPDERLAKIHNELITVKCELARCLNRENEAKVSLVQKDKEIFHLRQKKPEKDILKQQIKRETELKKVASKIREMEKRNDILNQEIFKLSRLLQQEQFKNHSKNLNIQEMRGEVDQLKRDYVFLLQSCIRLTCTEGPEMMELYMYGEKRHKQRVFALLEEARKSNPSLPNLEGITTSLCHVDNLGFKHLFVDKSLILHYVCRQLHHHYSSQLRSHERHLSAWKLYLRRFGNNLHSSPELKALVRGGIPGQLRSRVWTSLYRMRVQDICDNKGPGYFSNLCSMASESEFLEPHKRQISLDLLRTMPNNINFCDRTSDGIKKMQDVLNAFCLHNPKLGYCQGMNFLVGMMLLFMETEDAFWCLVAIVERYFTPSYFDQNLIGAQADQEVLKDLLKIKLPKLSSHLAALDIELCTITLNWFLSIFIDSVPLETLLRIWDCFLLEGPKVLFRISLAILLLQEEAILAKHDTVSIMRQLKAAAKLCFDVEGLVKAAFEDLEPFLKRQEISAKQASCYKVLLERAKKKERELQALRERERMMAQVELEGPHNHLIECAALWSKDKVWVCHGHHHGSRVSMVNCQENIMYRLHIEFESRVMCMHAPNDDTMLFGTFSHFVHAYHTVSRKKMWEICLNSCVLSLCSHQRDGVKQVFAGLADGTLAVVENVQGRMPKPEVFYVVIGPSPVTCLQLVGRRLWCASGSNVMILSARTLDLLDQFQTSSNGLDYIFRMISGEQGVWITLRGSTILQLWDPHCLTCRLLYDVRENYCTRALKVDEAYTNHARITSVLPFDSSVLVGTADGTLIIYDVVARKSPGASAPNSPKPQLPQPEPGQTNAEQIQERLQKLFIERELLDDKKSKLDIIAEKLDAIVENENNEDLSTCDANISDESVISEASIIQEGLTHESMVSEIQEILGNRLEDMKEEDEDEASEKVLEDVSSKKSNSESRVLDGLPIDTDREIRLYNKGVKKTPFIISTPIAEEPCIKLDDFSDDTMDHKEVADKLLKESDLNEVETKGTNKSEIIPHNKNGNLTENGRKVANVQKDKDTTMTDENQLIDKKSTFLQTENKLTTPDNYFLKQMKHHSIPHEIDSNISSTENPNTKTNISINIHSSSPDVSEDHEQREKSRNNVFNDFKNAGYKLKEAHLRFQSLSAENIPTWVMKEKPIPVISKQGDVTFRYQKSQLPSIKAYIRKEAGELARFLRFHGSLEKLGSDIDHQNICEEPNTFRPLYPSINIAKASPESEPFTINFPSVIKTPYNRPPSLNISSSHQRSKNSDRVTTPTAIEITVEGTSDPVSQKTDRSAVEQIDSRRSSASVQSVQDEIPFIIANDDDFLSTAQFNDLLQLQDWTRTSRKGSDTASNVSFGSAEVPFSFELLLKEKIKISDKPIRSLLLASCNNEPIIISCAGYYGDDEAVLKWNKEGDEKLWTNDPIVEVCPFTHTIKPSPYARSRMPRRASIATTSLSGSGDFDGTFGGRGSRSTSSPAASAGILVESGIAKVQHLLSRVHDRN